MNANYRFFIGNDVRRINVINNSYNCFVMVIKSLFVILIKHSPVEYFSDLLKRGVHEFVQIWQIWNKLAPTGIVAFDNIFSVFLWLLRRVKVFWIDRFFWSRRLGLVRESVYEVTVDLKRCFTKKILCTSFFSWLIVHILFSDHKYRKWLGVTFRIWKLEAKFQTEIGNWKYENRWN